MGTKAWLPRGFEIEEGTTTGKMLSSGALWQLFTTNHKGFVLAVDNQLYEKWVELELIPDSVFRTLPVNDREFRAAWDKYDSKIASVADGPYPDSLADIQAFVMAVRQARDKLGDRISFCDALYFERYSAILPTNFEERETDDKRLIGNYICAGVDISVEKFDRLCGLASWASPYWLEKILVDNGFLSGDGHARAYEEEQKKQEEEQKPRARSTGAPKAVPSDAKPAGRFSLPGRPKLEAFFNENIVEIVMNQEKYLRMGIDFPAAIVLHGPPGCGKTYAVEQLIDYLKWPSYYIDSGSVGSSYIHETSKKIAEMFDTAIKHAPSVLVIDEMEAFLTSRSLVSTSSPYHVEEVAEFLRRIPEASKNHVLVIAMTNLVDTVDPAILRRGRFDHIVEVEMPSAEEVSELLKHLLSTLPADEIDIERFSKELAGHPLSDVTFVMKEAGRLAVRRNSETITNELIADAISILPKTSKPMRKIGF